MPGEQLSRKWWLTATLKSLLIAASIVALAWVAPPTHAFDGALLAGAPGLLRLTGALVFLGLLALAGLWSWRRLTPIYLKSDGQRGYDLGMLGFGLGTAITGSVYQSYNHAGGAGLATLALRDFWIRFAVSVLVAVPIGLWAGRTWNYMMGFRRPD
jgi:hypothetical protein